MSRLTKARVAEIRERLARFEAFRDAPGSWPADAFDLLAALDATERELDAAQAALGALREAANTVLLYEGTADRELRTLDHQPIAEGTGPHARLRAALSTTPRER